MSVVSSGGRLARCSSVRASRPWRLTVRVISFGAFSATTGIFFSRQKRSIGAYISHPKPHRAFHSVFSSIAASSMSPRT